MSGNVRQSVYMGLGPQAFGGPNSGSGSSLPYPLETYQTPLLDFTKTYSNIELIPARPGFYPIGLNKLWMIESHSGTQTAPPTVQAGSDLLHANFFPVTSTTPTNANVNAIGTNGIASGPGSPASTLQRFPGMPVYFDLTVPAMGTGNYSCLGRLIITTYWFAVDGSGV